MANQPKLLEKIEKCRHEMLELSQQYGLTSTPVIESSKRLDNLLNQYYNVNV